LQKEKVPTTKSLRIRGGGEGSLLRKKKRDKILKGTAPFSRRRLTEERGRGDPAEKKGQPRCFPGGGGRGVGGGWCWEELFKGEPGKKKNTINGKTHHTSFKFVRKGETLDDLVNVTQK